MKTILERSIAQVKFEIKQNEVDSINEGTWGTVFYTHLLLLQNQLDPSGNQTIIKRLEKARKSGRYVKNEFKETGELLLDPEMIAIIGAEKARGLNTPNHRQF